MLRKTTTAAILFKELAKYGKQAEVVSIDDFYRDRIKDEPKPDFESAAAIDLEYFGKCVSELTGGREAQLPTFDFSTETRSGYHPHRLAENEIIVSKEFRQCILKSFATFQMKKEKQFI